MTDLILQESVPADAGLKRVLHRFALAAQAHNAALEALDAERAEPRPGCSPVSMKLW